MVRSCHPYVISHREDNASGNEGIDPSPCEGANREALDLPTTVRAGSEEGRKDRTPHMTNPSKASERKGNVGRKREKADPLAPQEELRGLPLFASVVAHEIRNPLSSVKIALQTVERHGKIGVKDGTRLRIALREVATIEKVLTDVLEWARPGELQRERSRPSEIAVAAVEKFGQHYEGRSVEVSLTRDTEERCITVDRSRVTNALVELLANAADASSPSSPIRLSVFCAEDSVSFAVEDEGNGFAPEAAERAFDPFFSTKARGVGLGLPRAQAAARNHGGEVLLQARTEGGVRAILSLSAPSDRNHGRAAATRKA
jgi:two-component system sensor histidine kinase HydH